MRSQFDVRPGDGGVISVPWVVVGGISEFTISVFGIECGSSSSGNLDEVINSKTISEVLVEVILEVLEEVHVFLNETVSTDSWEGESLIIIFPSVDSHLRVLALALETSVDHHSLFVTEFIEGSGESIEFLIKLFLGNIEGRFTRFSELNCTDRGK